MKLCSAGRLAIVAIMIGGPASVASAQVNGNDAAAGFNDPMFWQLVETGPTTSDELELVVTTYAANGLTAEVTNAFVDYLLRSDLESDPFCRYCSSLLADVDAPQGDGTLPGALRDAMEVVMERAFSRGAGDKLVRLAVMTGVSSHRKHQDHAFYFLIAASQLGIEDAWRDDVVYVLARSGFYAEALTIANSIYANPGSMHFQSADLGRWISYLEDALERNDLVSRIITAATN